MVNNMKELELTVSHYAFFPFHAKMKVKPNFEAAAVANNNI